MIKRKAVLSGVLKFYETNLKVYKVAIVAIR